MTDMNARVLFSFVGNHDPITIPVSGGDPGPVLSLLQERRFDHVVLFITQGAYSERARVIQRSIAEPRPKFSFVDIELQSVVDYEEIYEKLSRSIARVSSTFQSGSVEQYVLLDPGTPQMQTVWFLMVQSGALNATLLQGIPPRFGDGYYRSRVVRIDPNRFPIEMRVTGYAEGPKELSQPRNSRMRPADTVEDTPNPTEWTVVTTDIIGASSQMRDLMRDVERVARYSETVCITGETGTGKELVARHTHNRSGRRGNAFIALNAASLTTDLVESHLFGHTKGAFTGAVSERVGAFRSADGGTLFLDEVGELPLSAQSKLLRAIDQREITPVGYDRPVHVDVRLIVATHRDLAGMVTEGTFREDLYERLRPLPIHIPPLRDREGDVELLIDAFLSQWIHEHDEERRIAPDARQLLIAYDWPRNVRQLQNVVRQLCVFADSELIDAEAVRSALGSDDTPPVAPPATEPGPAPDNKAEAIYGPLYASSDVWSGRESIDLSSVLEKVERSFYAEALRRSEGNRADAARLLGINPPAFRKALRERFTDL